MIRPLAAALAVAMLAACSPVIEAGGALPTNSPRVNATTRATAPATPTPTTRDDPEPSLSTVDDLGLEAGEMAAVVTTDLVVRSAPGVRADSLIQPVTLSAPSLVYVIDGPVVADGYAWYLVDTARASSALGDYPAAGWVAAGAPDGEAWLAQHEPACEPELTTEVLVAITPQVALYCYAAQALSVEGVVGDCGTIVGSGRPWGGACLLYVPGRDPTSIPDGCVDACTPSVEVWFDHPLPADSSLLSVAGHFDDTAAQECVDERGEITIVSVHACRLAFVATDFTER